MLKSFVLSLFLFVGCVSPVAAQVSAPAPASAATAASSTLTAAQAQQALDALQDPKKRAAVIETLQAIVKAQSPGHPTTTPGGAATAAAAPIATKSSALVPNSLGAELLVELSTWAGLVSAELSATTRAMTDFPTLWHGLAAVLSDPVARAALLEGLGKLVLVFAGALVAEWLTALASRRPYRLIAAHAPLDDTEEAAAPRTAVPAGVGTEVVDPAESPAAVATLSIRRYAAESAWRLLRRLPFALARLLVELIPVAAFAAIGNLLLGSPIGDPETTRLVILAMVSAYVLCRGILCVGRALVSPAEPRLRLWHISDAAAAAILRWLRRITVVAVFGGALAEAGLLLGLDDASHDTLVRLVALVVTGLVIAAVLEARLPVAASIRPRDGLRGGLAGLRTWLADTWHFIAIVVIAASWVFWAADAGNGIGGLIHFLVGTAIVLVVSRLGTIVAIGTLDRLLRAASEDGEPTAAPRLGLRAAHYYRPLRSTLLAIIVAATAIALLQVWGLGSLAWFETGAIGRRLLSAAITIAIAAIVAAVVWEVANAAIDRRLERLSAESALARAARLRTLLPILRTTLLAAILTIVGLTALSEIGVNIAPLLAGAGIVGIAIGFGSQKLVQDVITGLFLLLENAIQVGDAVTVAGLSGAVEQLSIRTIWLRAGDGAVHIVPFSSVTSITNTNRGIGNASITVTIGSKEDPDRAIGELKQIAEALRTDPDYEPMIRGEFSVWIDKVTGVGVTLAGQVECTDSGRWPVQREFIRRMARRFQELAIEIADPK